MVSSGSVSRGFGWRTDRTPLIGLTHENARVLRVLVKYSISLVSSLLDLGD
jgi:hypothetical protein